MDKTVVRSVVLNHPKARSPRDVAAFYVLVREGGTVVPIRLRERIERAERLAFAYSDRNLAGVGALKRPNTAYRRSVFEKSKSSGSPAGFPFEIGWVNVKAEYRGCGIAGLLVKELLKAAGDRNVFATSSINNTPMHKSLERAGFKRNGEPYVSDMRADKLQLFVRVAVQPSLAVDVPEAARC